MNSTNRVLNRLLILLFGLVLLAVGIAAILLGTVMEVRDGKVHRWWDYFDLSTLMNAAPAWWVEHIAKGYK